MSTNENGAIAEFEEIERYVLNQMGADEAAAFAARLSADAELQARTRELKMLSIAIQESALESQLPTFHNGVNVAKVSSKPKSHILGISAKWLVAASVILLLGFSAWWGLLRETESERLFSAYYKPDPGLISAMGISENYAFDHAMIEYKTGNYKKAIKEWDSLRVIQPANDTLNYFLGSAYLGDQKLNEAVIYLQKVSKTKSAFVNDANWFLGLALLKQGKRQEGIRYIKKSTHPQKVQMLYKLHN